MYKRREDIIREGTRNHLLRAEVDPLRLLRPVDGLDLADIFLALPGDLLALFRLLPVEGLERDEPGRRATAMQLELSITSEIMVGSFKEK